MYKFALILFLLTFLSCKDNKTVEKKTTPTVQMLSNQNNVISDAKLRVEFDRGRIEKFIKQPEYFTSDILGNINSAGKYSAKTGDHSIISSFEMNNEFTLSIWTKPYKNKGQDFYPIINKSINGKSEWPFYEFFIGIRAQDYESSPNTFFCWVGLEDELISVSSIINWQPERWYHLAVTKSQDYLKFFVNGKLQSQKQITKKLRASQEPIFISKHYLFDLYYDGAIDDLQVYDRALSFDEIVLLSE